MTEKWNTTFAESSPYTYRLLLQHTHDSSTALFYNGNDAPPISPYPHLVLKGHDHALRVNSSNPFLVYPREDGKLGKMDRESFSTSILMITTHGPVHRLPHHLV